MIENGNELGTATGFVVRMAKYAEQQNHEEMPGQTLADKLFVMTSATNVLKRAGGDERVFVDSLKLWLGKPKLVGE